LQWRKRNGSHFAMPLTNPTEAKVFDEMLFDIPRLCISQLALICCLACYGMYQR
jgi:hypothetical protein